MNKALKKTILIVSLLGIIVLAVGGWYMYLLGRAFDSACGQEVVQTAVSPDRRYVVDVTISDCGATTNYVTTVTISPTNEMEKGYSFLEVKKSKNVRVSWSSSNKISVIYPSLNVDVFGGLPHWRDVDITYLPTNSDEIR